MVDETREKLEAPFPPDEVSVKPGATVNSPSKGPAGLALAYIDARCVMKRLDDVFGPNNWEFTVEPIPDSNRVAVIGTIKVKYVNPEYGLMITEKSDIGEGGKEEEPWKAAASDALKRAAVHWGIGRYLYNLPQLWWSYNPQKKKFNELESLKKQLFGRK